MTVIFTNELRSKILLRIEALRSDLSIRNFDLRRVVTEIAALPLCLDSGGGFALMPTGAVVVFSWDNLTAVTEVDDLRLMNIALFQGIKKYPELEELTPVKPSNATICPYCGGTGYPSAAANSAIENIVCYCGGAGWIPPLTAEDA